MNQYKSMHLDPTWNEYFKCIKNMQHESKKILFLIARKNSYVYLLYNKGPRFCFLYLLIYEMTVTMTLTRMYCVYIYICMYVYIWHFVIFPAHLKQKYNQIEVLFLVSTEYARCLAQGWVLIVQKTLTIDIKM